MKEKKKNKNKEDNVCAVGDDDLDDEATRMVTMRRWRKEADDDDDGEDNDVMDSTSPLVLPPLSFHCCNLFPAILTGTYTPTSSSRHPESSDPLVRSRNVFGL